MRNLTQSSVKVCCVLIILMLSGILIALDGSGANGPDAQIARHPGENKASYEALARAAATTKLDVTLLHIQPEETDAAYQARLLRTIKGLIQLATPIVVRHPGESDAPHQARCRATIRDSVALYSPLIARPGEHRAAYHARLAVWKEAWSTVVRRGDNDVAYRARRARAGQRAMVVHRTRLSSSNAQ